ncbi:MAG: hypothetical protein ACI4L9_06210 [Candidatus Coproplasma sp.]
MGEELRNKSVAVLDIRSSEICACIGERGVNGTFIIKSKYSCDYEGYADGKILDVKSFNQAIKQAVQNALSAVRDRINTFYVGVPGEFLKLVNTDKTVGFSSPKKINSAHLSQLKEASVPDCESGYSVIKCSPLYYILADKRRLIDPKGFVTDSLRGKLCFYLCKDSFAGIVAEAFSCFNNVTDIDFIPTGLAEANYLIQPEQRDNYAVLFDLGYISSTYSVVCGNGVLFSESFSVGTGHIAALLMDELDIPFDVATQFLSKVNLNAKERLTSVQEIKYGGKMYSFSTVTLRDVIREGLDGICEIIEECRQSFTGKDLSGKPILLTGEGVKTIRGTAEHLSSRLVALVEIIAPKVPCFDKPKYSSLLSLLDAALGD